jgi:hypothetical protein
MLQHTTDIPSHRRNFNLHFDHPLLPFAGVPAAEAASKRLVASKSSIAPSPRFQTHHHHQTAFVAPSAVRRVHQSWLRPTERKPVRKSRTTKGVEHRSGQTRVTYSDLDHYTHRDLSTSLHHHSSYRIITSCVRVRNARQPLPFSHKIRPPENNDRPEGDGQLSGQTGVTCNDPSASPQTETLLRLLLPLNDQSWSTFRPSAVVADLPGPVRRPRRAIQSVRYPVLHGGASVLRHPELQPRRYATYAYWSSPAASQRISSQLKLRET